MKKNFFSLIFLLLLFCLCSCNNSLTLCEALVPSLLKNVKGGDSILNKFFAKAFMPAAEAFKNNNN